MESFEIINTLWHGLGQPLIRLVFFISLGLIVANLIESLNWTHGVARVATPLVRLGHLSETTGASFSMAFFSSVAANTMLSEAYDQGAISKRELIFANLFNSLPTFFLHLPTLFFIAAPLIKQTAFLYVGLTMSAAGIRTAVIIILGRLILTVKETNCVSCLLAQEKTKWRSALTKTWDRFRKRINKILIFTIPIYTLIFLLNQYGLFEVIEKAISRHLSFLAWLQPQSVGIVALQLTAELAAGLAAAGALLDSGGLNSREVVLALLAGNVLSSPMRAIRHQLPFYSGIFRPRLAVELIFYNQLFRTGSIVLVAAIYYFLSAS